MRARDEARDFHEPDRQSSRDHASPVVAELGTDTTGVSILSHIDRLLLRDPVQAGCVVFEPLRVLLRRRAGRSEAQVRRQNFETCETQHPALDGAQDCVDVSVPAVLRIDGPWAAGRDRHQGAFALTWPDFRYSACAASVMWSFRQFPGSQGVPIRISPGHIQCQQLAPPFPTSELAAALKSPRQLAAKRLQCTAPLGSSPLR